jgi:hypothetical protein
MITLTLPPLSTGNASCFHTLEDFITGYMIRCSKCGYEMLTNNSIFK